MYSILVNPFAKHTVFILNKKIIALHCVRDVSLHIFDLSSVLSLTMEPTVEIILPFTNVYACVCWVILCVYIYIYINVCSGYTLKSFPLFCQVGCQNLTGVSTSLSRIGVSCSCSFMREGFQSKVNIRSGSSLSQMQLGPTVKTSLTICWVYVQWCRVKICFMANDIQLSQLPVCIPSCTPNTERPGFMGRQTKTCAETETRAVIRSCLMVREGKGRGVFHTEDWCWLSAPNLKVAHRHPTWDLLMLVLYQHA